MLKYCPECRTGNELENKFCVKCGKKLIKEVPLGLKKVSVKKHKDKSKDKTIESKEFEEKSFDKKPSSKLKEVDTFESSSSKKSTEESEREKWRNEASPIINIKESKIPSRYSYWNFILIGILALVLAYFSSILMLLVYMHTGNVSTAPGVVSVSPFTIPFLSVVYFLIGIYINSRAKTSKKMEDGRKKKISNFDYKTKAPIRNNLSKAIEWKMVRTKKVAIVVPLVIIVAVVLFLVVDADGDGLNNLSEIQKGTGIFNSDSDSDGLNDGDELNNYGTNPLDYDCDNDYIEDGEEIDTYGTNPLDDDTDDDGLGDYKEIHTYGTNPLSPDSDSDGLNDKDEIDTYGTNPLDDDTDDDGLNDGDEVEIGTDPFDYDSDNDNYGDGSDPHPTIHEWKLTDSDDDGLTDWDEEYVEHTDRFNSDTDGDGAPDGYDAHPLSTSKKTRKYYRWEYPEGTTWTWEIYVSYDLYVYESQLDRISSWSRWSEYTLDPTAKQFASELKETVNNKGFNYYQTVNFVLSFVQSLAYTSDDVTTGADEYPRYPLETLYEDGGDCEDASILFSSILKEMNIDNCLALLPDAHHAMVGVLGHDDYQGSSWSHDGKKYYCCETTGEGFRMGDFPSSLTSSQAKLYNVGTSNPITPLRGTEFSFQPTDDTYICSISPGNNKNDGYLGTHSYPNNYEIIYLTFDFSEISTTSLIKNAKLELYSYLVLGTPVVNVHRCYDTSWDESSITWNNAPSYSSVVDDNKTVTSEDKWYSWDVTEIIEDAIISGKVTFVLETPDQDAVLFCSKEYYSNHPPKLEIKIE